jgi:hypothetical protein
MPFSVPPDIVAKTRIAFCLQALEGKPYAWPAMEEFLDRVGYGTDKITPKAARQILNDRVKISHFIDNVGVSLRQTGITENSEDVQQKAEGLFHIMTATLLLDNTDPVSGRRTSFNVNVKAGVIVGGIFLVGGALTGPFSAVIFKKAAERFDVYWNGKSEPAQCPTPAASQSKTSQQPKNVMSPSNHTKRVVQRHTP